MLLVFSGEDVEADGGDDDDEEGLLLFFGFIERCCCCCCCNLVAVVTVLTVMYKLTSERRTEVEIGRRSKLFVEARHNREPSSRTPEIGTVPASTRGSPSKSRSASTRAFVALPQSERRVEDSTKVVVVMTGLLLLFLFSFDGGVIVFLLVSDDFRRIAAGGANLSAPPTPVPTPAVAASAVELLLID